jgi:hypothetical protein
MDRGRVFVLLVQCRILSHISFDKQENTTIAEYVILGEVAVRIPC